MNLNIINEIITNDKSKELSIEIIIGEKKYTIDSLNSNYDNNVLEVTVQEKQ